MSTITIEVSDDLAKWLKDKAEKAGKTPGEIVQAELERVRLELAASAWAKYAGVVDGAPDLSTREGFGSR